MITNPALFGLQYSNRDFSTEEGWSKNNFNATFPAALACYMYSQSINPIYLVLNSEGKLIHSQIKVSDLFGLPPLDDDLFFAFESDFTPYQQLIVGSLPCIDLVTLQRSTSLSLRGLEIKLTALPDNSTYHLDDNGYSCEIVIRPDTIVYLALSIAFAFKDQRLTLLELLMTTPFQIDDWNSGEEILPYLPVMVKNLTHIMNESAHLQHPLLM